MTGPPRRRWFRFTLRTFFVLLTVFGVWLGYQVKWIRDRREAAHWVEKDGGLLYKGAASPWSLRLLGEEGYKSLRLRENRRKEEMQVLFPEADIGPMRYLESEGFLPGRPH